MLQVMFVMAIQFVMAYHVRNLPWWKVLVVAYTVSGTCNQNLLSAQHEISHFLALRKPFWNKVLAIASNCPIVVPVATKFRQYHQEHHSHLVSHIALACCSCFLARIWFLLLLCTVAAQPAVLVSSPECGSCCCHALSLLIALKAVTSSLNTWHTEHSVSIMHAVQRVQSLDSVLQFVV